MTQYQTPLYGVTYADDLEPLANYPALTQAVAQTVDAALVRGGVVPPGAADLTAEAATRAAADAALSTRATTLEQKARAVIYCGTTSAVQTANTWITCTLDQELVDTANGHAAGAAGYTVPAGRGGLWLISGHVAHAAVAGGTTIASRIQVNGAQPAGGKGPWGAANASGSVLGVDASVFTLAAGDVVTIGMNLSNNFQYLGGASSADVCRLTLVQL